MKGDGASPRELRTYQDWVGRARSCGSIPGVADVVSLGGLIKQYEVRPDLAQAARLQGDARAALSGASSAATPTPAAAIVEQGRQQYLIRGIGLFAGPEDIDNVVVAERGGAPILVKHVARGRASARCRARASPGRTTTTTSSPAWC